jgi:hypothetical protein
MDRVQEIWMALLGERRDLCELAAQISACDDLLVMMDLMKKLRATSAIERKLTKAFEDARALQLSQHEITTQPFKPTNEAA